MLNYLGLLLAASIAAYTLFYAFYIWREERNPGGALAVAVLALAAAALPVYILFFRA